MAGNDIDRENQASSPVQITGADELHKASVNSGKSVGVYDAPTMGDDLVLNLTTTPVEVKVGASAKENRVYIEMQALTKNVKWGYTTACNFDLFKSQFFSLPAGTNCKIYMKSSTGTAQAVIAEKYQAAV